jgi:hypothetical protein
MGRSNYSDDLDQWELIRWRGAVASAIRGSRGQRFLRDMKTALEAMPVKRLIAHELETFEGEVCALGAVGKARGIDMRDLDPGEADEIASTFVVSQALVREISHLNDEWGDPTPEERYSRMLAWVSQQIQDGKELHEQGRS